MCFSIGVYLRIKNLINNNISNIEKPIKNNINTGIVILKYLVKIIIENTT